VALAASDLSIITLTGLAKERAEDPAMEAMFVRRARGGEAAGTKSVRATGRWLAAAG